MTLSRTTLAALLLLTPAAFAQTKVTPAPFGTLPDGSKVTQFTLSSSKLTVKIITFGAHITDILAPDRAGQKADVVLGYDTLAGYLADNGTYMGSIVGRYGNRIAKGTFTLDGQQYHLPQNDHGNTLHGGTLGFDRKNWTAKPIPQGVELTLVSPDGDQGFPGTLTAHVRYTLVANALHIDYAASTDKPTVTNLTNHTYFNLAGSGDILPEIVTIPADRITPVDATLIPTGNYMQVEGSAFDFRTPTAIGARISAQDPQLIAAAGYDHNYVLTTTAGHTLHPIATVVDPASGRTLTVTSTEPGVQFYSGNHLDGSFKGRDGSPYVVHSGFCLETQHFPDSPNEPSFPTTELKPGQPYHSSTVFTFTAAR